MRVAPIALHFAEIGKPIEEADLLAAHACALTHGHPFGCLSGAALVHIIYRIMEGSSVRDAMTDAADALPSVFPDCRHHACQTSDLIRKAVDLADQDLSDLDAIHQLGEGWVGEEALAIAVYCACKYPDDPDRCLIAAVNHKGDSDSTGAVAGNIVGAAVGYEAIPDKYREHLELSGTILKIADQLRTRR